MALNLPMVILDKERLGDTETVVMRNIIGNPEGKDVLLVDDEILSGDSMLEAVKMLKEHGAKRIWAGCTHGFFTGDAMKNIQNSLIEEIVTTNTLCQSENTHCEKLIVLSVASMFAEAIKAIHMGQSIGALMDRMKK